MLLQRLWHAFSFHTFRCECAPGRHSTQPSASYLSTQYSKTRSEIIFISTWIFNHLRHYIYIFIYTTAEIYCMTFQTRNAFASQWSSRVAITVSKYDLHTLRSLMASHPRLARKKRIFEMPLNEHTAHFRYWWKCF